MAGARIKQGTIALRADMPVPSVRADPHVLGATSSPSGVKGEAQEVSSALLELSLSHGSVARWAVVDQLAEATP